ncbi:MAG: hypothetical protein ACTHJM_09165 [Marmoricola sp.]
MSKERDELADVIAHSSMRMASKGVIRYSADGYPVYQADEMAANAVFNAGYRKPAVVTTAEELDALPTGSVVLDDLLITHSKPYNALNFWLRVGFEEHFTADDIALPATILHVGGES